MKKILLNTMVLVCFASPLATFAEEVGFRDKGGSFSNSQLSQQARDFSLMSWQLKAQGSQGSSKEWREFASLATTPLQKAQFSALFWGLSNPKELGFSESDYTDLDLLCNNWSKDYFIKLVDEGLMDGEAVTYRPKSWSKGSEGVLAEWVIAWSHREERSENINQGVERMAHAIRSAATRSSSWMPSLHRSPEVEGRSSAQAFFPDGQGGLDFGQHYRLIDGRQLLALVKAYQMFDDKRFLFAAEEEAVGFIGQLAASGQLNRWFVPLPVGEGGQEEVAVIVEAMEALYAETQKPLYAILSGFVAKDSLAEESDSELTRWIESRLNKMPLSLTIAKGKSKKEPLGAVLCEVEQAQAVAKAFDVCDFTYPSGDKGAAAAVGLSQDFWMRFDVEEQGFYDFYLSFLRQNVSGSMNAITMRIDGDRIFEVAIGGSKEDNQLDFQLVEENRFLRYGPHSFGIKFSGLLPEPAVMDAVYILPNVEKRSVVTEKGEHLLLLKNTRGREAKTLLPELEGVKVNSIQIWGNKGQKADFKTEIDRRHRRTFYVLPPQAIAVIRYD